MNVIKFTLYGERPATQADVDEQDAWLLKHPNTSCDPLKPGEMIDAEDEHELPAVWAICSRCEGEGKHVNPNVDGHGISAEEWEQEWDKESREGYFRGDYDVTCEARCKDGKVLEVAGDDQLSPEQQLFAKRYAEQLEERAQSDAEDRHTRYMESGGHY